LSKSVFEQGRLLHCRLLSMRRFGCETIARERHLNPRRTSPGIAFDAVPRSIGELRPSSVLFAETEATRHEMLSFVEHHRHQETV
jgi:hypothetical protein